MRTKNMRVFAENDDSEVVVSGMSGRFPNSRNIADLDYHLYNKIDMCDDDERRWKHTNPENPKRAGKIYDLEKFDAGFFGIHNKLADSTDPQIRILLEVAYESILDAGINPKTLAGTKTGVYIGISNTEAEEKWLFQKSDTTFGIVGNSRSMAANRISYCFDFKGPSLAVDTACSSSAYAFDHAFTDFRTGEIDAAIVAGSNLALHPNLCTQFARLGVLAKDGVCRPFDENASGFTRAETIACVFLQRKKDCKRIYAEVVYSKSNCDGYKNMGITYPSGEVQEVLLREFYSNLSGKVHTKDIGYVEAHGTGTVVGDPEELKAIDNVIASQREEPLLIGSIKSNMGHSEPSSGICSIIKVLLAFNNGCIPPNINFTKAKKSIKGIAEGRLKVVLETTPLQKPYAATNCFGFGGANVHVLLKVNEKEKPKVKESVIPRLVCWSGRTEESVNYMLEELTKHPLDSEFLALLDNIQAKNISGFVHRGYGVFANGENGNGRCLKSGVSNFNGDRRPVVWLFGGMGSQWFQMGKDLMKIPVFRDTIKRLHGFLKPKAIDFMQIITSDDPKVLEASIIHQFIGITGIQIGLVNILREINIEPDYIIGHSAGEVACGYADGGLTEEQTILMSYYRGYVCLKNNKTKGMMAAFGISYKEVLPMLPPDIDAPVHNSSTSCTVSGPYESVKKFVEEATAKGIFARSVDTGNMAFHSRYVTSFRQDLVAFIKDIIPNPKKRTEKWISTSVLADDWGTGDSVYCSAEYSANNLCGNVYFEENTQLLPPTSIFIEIGPHAILSSVIKKSLPDSIQIGLTKRGELEGTIYLLRALGEFFNHGENFDVKNLYPAVDFPVSKGTRGISSLIKWDHSEDYFVPTFMTGSSGGGKQIKVNLQDEKFKYIEGHVIDGKILVPATAYLKFVWEAFIDQNDCDPADPVEFSDVRFVRATNMNEDTIVELNVNIQVGTGMFEISEATTLVCTGVIKKLHKSIKQRPLPTPERTIYPVLTNRDFYKELKLRGYHYIKEFQVAIDVRADGAYSKLKWNNNWVTFLDGMMQTFVVGTDSRSLQLPTRLRKLAINPEKMVHPEVEVFYNRDLNRISCDGVDIIGLHASPVQRRKPPAEPILETYKFVPNMTPEATVPDAAKICVQLYLENVATQKLVVLEIDNVTPTIEFFSQAIEDIPLVSGEFFLKTSEKVDISGVSIVEDHEFPEACNFIIAHEFKEEFSKLLINEGYFIVKSDTGEDETPKGYKRICEQYIVEDNIFFIAFQKAPTANNLGKIACVEVLSSDESFTWIRRVQDSMANGQEIILVSQIDIYSGLLGLVNTLRKEPEGHLIRAVYINDPNAPTFSLEKNFYRKQMELGFVINVLQNGEWGTYRHLQITKTLKEERHPLKHFYGNVLNRGDLSSLRWFQGPSTPERSEVEVAYSSINFKDVMLATGRLAVETCGDTRLKQSLVLGLEYSGIHKKTGRRIMGMSVKGGIASHITKITPLWWDVPQSWTLREAATAPVVYTTVYYAFFFITKIQKGQSILIHAGTGGIGLAAIRTAIMYGLEVFTTCSSEEKKKYILCTFPQVKASHVGNSRDSSFEDMVMTETNGRGVDYVLNSLSEDMLLASVRCLGEGGTFLEIGKFDMAADNKIGLGEFLKGISFRVVLVDQLFNNFHDKKTMEKVAELREMIDNDMANNIIQPLPSTVFISKDIEQAFRHLVGGKHIGKVLIQVRDTLNSKQILPVKMIPQVYFNPDLIYIIAGGLGGFGLELADWMVLRGARKLILSSSRGISQSYQQYRISLWSTYGCSTLIAIDDITTKEGCKSLLDKALKIAPIGGIFNLAVSLCDCIFTNQTAELFTQAFGPKVNATLYLDEFSRNMCPMLHQFVVFSSAACGRGNAGQTNYAMANSIMERIIEDRVDNNLPGKAIQWGAVGDVGLIAKLVDGHAELEVGGTLQQRISSCLNELDTLLTHPEPIVSSMVVAEKRYGASDGSVSLFDSVLNIMGVRDTKSISLNTTLNEMGLDSLMTVELKQLLERDYDMNLSTQEIRSLTFQMVQDMSNKKGFGKAPNSEVSEVDSIFGLNLILRNLGEENKADVTILPLTENGKFLPNKKSLFIIPGIEGIAGNAWTTFASKFKDQAAVLQLHNMRHTTNIQDVSKSLYNEVKSVLGNQSEFCVIGYSCGYSIAVELVRVFESNGNIGKLILIDGSPEFIKKLMIKYFGEVTDENMSTMIISFILLQLAPGEKQEDIIKKLTNLPSDEKYKILKEYVEKHSKYSADYMVNLTNGMMNRLKIAYNYQFTEKLKSPILLIRPKDISLTDVAEDYDLAKMTSGKVDVKFVEGNHTTILDNLELVQMVNDFV